MCQKEIHVSKNKSTYKNNFDKDNPLYFVHGYISYERHVIDYLTAGSHMGGHLEFL